MKEYIEREAVNALIEAECSPKVAAFLNHAIDNIPAADVVPVGAYNQAAWERDTAVEQLKQIGKSFGERMDDVRPVVRGRWEWDVLDGTPGYRPVVLCCSNCHRVSFSGWDFCPNCGADMREGET